MGFFHAWGLNRALLLSTSLRGVRYARQRIPNTEAISGVPHGSAKRMHYTSCVVDGAYNQSVPTGLTPISIGALRPPAPFGLRAASR